VKNGKGELDLKNDNDDQIIENMRCRLLKNFLDLFVLSQLEKAPMSGYDLINFVHKRFDIMLSAGTAYSILYRLERQRLVTAEWRKRERVYILTEKGKHSIQVVTKEIDQLQNFLSLLLRK